MAYVLPTLRPAMTRREEGEGVSASPFYARNCVHLLNHARNVLHTLDAGLTHDGAGQTMNWLIEMLEAVQGEVYLWRQGELDDEQAIEAVRDAIGF